MTVQCIVQIKDWQTKICCPIHTKRDALEIAYIVFQGYEKDRGKLPDRDKRDSLGYLYRTLKGLIR